MTCEEFALHHIFQSCPLLRKDFSSGVDTPQSTKIEPLSINPSQQTLSAPRFGKAELNGCDLKPSVSNCGTQEPSEPFMANYFERPLGSKARQQGMSPPSRVKFSDSLSDLIAEASERVELWTFME